MVRFCPPQLSLYKVRCVAFVEIVEKCFSTQEPISQEPQEASASCQRYMWPLSILRSCTPKSYVQKYNHIVYECVCMCMSVCMCMNVCACVRMCACIRMCVYMCTSVCVYLPNFRLKFFLNTFLHTQSLTGSHPDRYFLFGISLLE